MELRNQSYERLHPPKLFPMTKIIATQAASSVAQNGTGFYTFGNDGNDTLALPAQSRV